MLKNVVQVLVGDASLPQAFQLITELLDAVRKFSGRDAQGNLRDGWLRQPRQSVGSVAPQSTIACSGDMARKQGLEA